MPTTDYFQIEIEHDGEDYLLEYTYTPGRTYPQTSFDPPDPPDPPECEIVRLWIYEDETDDFVDANHPFIEGVLLDKYFDELVEHAEAQWHDWEEEELARLENLQDEMRAEEQYFDDCWDEDY